MSQALSAQAVHQTKPCFWARQFSLTSTRAQERFDAVFGVILPIVCLLVDPVVFQGGRLLAGQPLLGRYQVFAYLFCALQVGVYLTWRTLNRHVLPASALIGGTLIAGSFFSFTVGLLILPYTLIGLIVLIGAAGFTPFFSAFVYLRNGIRALKAQQRNSAFESRVLLAIAAGLLSIGLPALFSDQYAKVVTRSLDELLYGDAIRAELAVDRLKRMPFVPEIDRRQIVLAYESEMNHDKKVVLKRYYWDLTGRDIQVDLYMMRD